MIRALRAIIRKDVLLFIGDRRAVLFSIVLPLALTGFFGFVFGGKSGKMDEARIEVQVVQEDDSAVARAVTRNLTQDSHLRVTMGSIEGAKSAILHNKLAAAVVIPAHFGKAATQALLASGAETKPRITLLYDPSRSMEMNIVQGFLAQHVMQAVTQAAFSAQSLTQLADTSLQTLEEAAAITPSTEPQKAMITLLRSVKDFYNTPHAAAPGTQSQTPFAEGLQLPYQTETQPMTANEQAEYNGFAHSLVGMTIQFTLFMAIDAAVAMLTERERGLLKRFWLSPLRPGFFVMARFISSALISAMVMLLVFGIGTRLFHIEMQGSYAGFFLVCLATGAMTSAFGLMIASIGKTAASTRGLSSFAILIMVMLSGAWVPSFLFPQWLQNLSLAIPSRWAIDGLEAMLWRGLPFTAALQSCAALLAFTALFFGIALLRFRREN